MWKLQQNQNKSASTLQYVVEWDMETGKDDEEQEVRTEVKGMRKRIWNRERKIKRL
jgi:hypothetical protein